MFLLIQELPVSVFEVQLVLRKHLLHESQSPQNLTHSPVFKAAWAAVLLNLLRTGTLQKTFLLGGLKQDKQVVTDSS